MKDKPALAILPRIQLAVASIGQPSFPSLTLWSGCFDLLKMTVPLSVPEVLAYRQARQYLC